MSERPRYLVIVPSGMERTPALFRAMALAKQTDAEIHLGLFDYDAALHKAQSQGFDLDAYLEGRRRELEEFAAHPRREGFTVKAVARWGSPVTKQVLAEIAALEPDLVIKDVHAEAALRRLLFTSRDFELLRLCPVPLMLVKPGDGNLPKHIMAAVDPLDENGRPHELNARILEAAEKYGIVSGAAVEVVHAFQATSLAASAAVFGGGGIADPALMGELKDEHAEAFRALGSASGVEERHLHMIEGFAPEALARFADTYRIDLLIVGTVIRSGVERFLLGSVAEQLFERAHCDVLAVKAGEIT
jgi:universal stress protein E